MTGQLKIMDGHGHTAVKWDTEEEAAVAEAEAIFKAQMSTPGTTAFATKPGSAEPAEKIKEFDPQVESIVIVKQMAGGC